MCVGKFRSNSVMCHSNNLPSKSWHTRKTLEIDSGCKVLHLNSGSLDSGRLETYTVDTWMLWLWMLWPRTLECLETWMFGLWTLGFLDKYLLGHLSTLFLNVLTIGGGFSNISVRGSFCAFFARLCHASVKVYVQMNYLFSRSSPSKEAAVWKSILTSALKKYLSQKKLL